MKSIFKNAIIAAALVFGAASISNAQVKIGANPTTIGANNALEVEAASNKKVSVNKADGTLTIENTPASVNAADKVIGVDGTGKVVTIPNTTVPSAPHLRFQGYFTTYSNIPSNPTIALNLSTTLVNGGISYTPSAGVITVTPEAAGVYFLSASVTGATLQNTTQNDVCLFFYGDTQSYDAVCSRTTGTGGGYMAGGTATISGLFRLNAGVNYTLRITTASANNNEAPYPIAASFYKMSN